MTDEQKVREAFEAWHEMPEHDSGPRDAWEAWQAAWQAALSHASATAEECSVDAKIPLVVRTAPERIFLQVADDDAYMDESFPEDESEVTWCAQPTLPCEVEYVRADLRSIDQAIAAKRGEQS